MEQKIGSIINHDAGSYLAIFLVDFATKIGLISKQYYLNYKDAQTLGFVKYVNDGINVLPNE